METYIRGGKITGVIHNNTKYRLKTLGFTEERIQELDKSSNRAKDMSEQRMKTKDKTINRNR